ncbi:MAG: alpha/beta hydrolase [Firmicutes bacterium]|nr:alpha/beta hydrolase [Bacillota bacterium]
MNRHILSILLFGTNISAMLAGLVYILTPEHVNNLAGSAIPLALLANTLVACHTRSGKFGTIYLHFAIFAVAVMPLALFGISNARKISGYTAVHPLLPILLYGAFFGLFALGSRLRLGSGNYRLRNNWCPSKTLLAILLAFGASLAYVLISRHGFGLEMFVAPFSLFYAFIFLNVTVLLLKLNHWRPSLENWFLGLSGALIFVIFTLPLLLTPQMARQAEAEFNRTFGDQGEDFKFSFSLPAYFLGVPHARCQIVEHQLFYQEGELELYYDAFIPPPEKLKPEGNTTIIRLHGGGWSVGNKGKGNRLQLSKFLAEQGYVVFDIQYGLANVLDIGLTTPPDYLRGDYSIDDMLEHIGHFTYYLAEHADRYGADLESVFISGNSAGGHLATVAGLATAAGSYPELFNDQLKIRGIISLYPAYQLAPALGLAGREDFLYPELLVDAVSPPCLILQGVNDVMVPVENVQAFSEHYNAYPEVNLALLKFPLAGHSADIHFGGIYSQLFNHYMLRFLELHK